MDTIALNCTAGWPSSIRRSGVAPTILRSQHPSSRLCTCQQQRQQLRSPFENPHSKSGIQGAAAAWAESVGPLGRRERGRRRRWSTEHGIIIGRPAWQLKHGTNSPPWPGVDIRIHGGSRHSENLWVRHEAPGSEVIAARPKGNLQCRAVTAHHHHVHHPNSKGFSISAKLEQGQNVWAKRKGSGWGNPGGNVWAGKGPSLTALHHHVQHPNSNGFSISAKLEQGCNVSAKQKGSVWSNPGGNVWAKHRGKVWARRGVKANLAGAPLSSREEASGANEAQQSAAEAAAAAAAATSNGYDGGTSTSTMVLDRKPITGGAVDFHGATLPLTKVPLVVTKKIVIVRHGLSEWNAESRIQGSSDLSKLSEAGIAQAERCKQALAKLKFNVCFSSPISRAKTSAEVIWSGREEPLVFLDSLKEANLHFLEGMRNVDAKQQFPELYNAWREDPVNFNVDGVYPVVKLWGQAKEAWQEILSVDGDLVLIITHKSILRALLCTALGLGPERFRSVDINNGGISVFTVNTRGEPMLQCLNMTAHLHVDGVFY